MPVGNREAALDYGGDFQIGPDGDLAIVEDDANDAPASTQRLIFLVLTVPIFRDQNGDPLTEPDDICHCDYGAGLPAMVDELLTPQTLATVEAQIRSAIAADSAFVQNPAPTIVFTTIDTETESVTVSATTVSGVLVTTPALPLVATGVSLQGG